MLTSWDKFFTVQGGAKRPSNVEITCDQSLISPTFFPINVKNKGRSFHLSRVFRKQGCCRSHKAGKYGQTWSALSIFFLPSKNNWNFLVPISWLGL